GVDDGHGSRTHLGFRADGVDRMKRGLVAFCFPGQGSLEVGMGREVATAVPEAMEVFERSSLAAGLDLQRLCFEASEEELVETEVQQPALVATSLAVLAAVRARGIMPDFVVGHSVGEFAALAAAGALEEEGARRAVKLRVSGAFHSPLVARAADRLRPALERVKFAEPTAPFMSTVTARIESAKRMAPLLVEQLTAPVRFTQAAQALIKDGAQTFVEVGPGNVLGGLVKRIDRSVKTVSVATPEEIDKLEETLA